MMNPGGGMGGMFRQPAQRETISGGYEGGVKIPVIQAFASVVFASLCILFVWILLFVIGPDVIWCAGFAAIVLVARRVWRWISTAQQETQEEINGARAMTIGTCAIALALLGAWAASRQFCVSIWPVVLPPVSALRTVFAVTFIIPPIAVCALMAFQFAVNAYNPAAFQPHMAKPSGTPWWSPTGQEIVETAPEYEYQQIAQAIREIPRPVPAYGNGNPNPNGSAVQDRLTDASERQHATQSEPPVNDRFIAPGGRTVRVADLNEFVLDGVVVGATFKTWHARKGWGEEYWTAIAKTCSQHGIVKSPGPRSRTRFMIKSRHEAAAALDHLWRHVFPSHRPAKQSVGDENEGDVWQTDTIKLTEQN